MRNVSKDDKISIKIDEIVWKKINLFVFAAFQTMK